MTEQSQQQPAHQDPPTTYANPVYRAEHWPPLAGGPGIPPSDRRGFFKKHGMTLGLMGVTLVVAGSLGVGIGKATAGTPASCKEAIDLANEGFSLAGDAIGYSTDAIEAAGDRDYSAMGRASDDMDDVSSEIGPVIDKYKTATEACTGEKP